jgi:hypothetical protein
MDNIRNAAPQHVDFWALQRIHGIIKMLAELSATSMTKLAATDQLVLMDGPHLSKEFSGDGPRSGQATLVKGGLPRD